MGADDRAFLDATLPYLEVVYQVARHAAGDGLEPEDLVQEAYLWPEPSWRPPNSGFDLDLIAAVPGGGPP
jgi:hypothetical protein